jgi:hypothetical protein
MIIERRYDAGREAKEQIAWKIRGKKEESEVKIGVRSPPTSYALLRKTACLSKTGALLSSR